MYHSILVGQDASEYSHQALGLAIWLAKATHARLHLIHLHSVVLTASRHSEKTPTNTPLAWIGDTNCMTELTQAFKRTAMSMIRLDPIRRMSC